MLPSTSTFPWPVLVVNLAGSLLLGALLAHEAESRFRVLLHDAGAIGFCGGFTTFATYTVGVVDLLETHEVVTALTYTLSSVVGTIAAILVGASGLRRRRAADRRDEQAP